MRELRPSPAYVLPALPLPALVSEICSEFPEFEALTVEMLMEREDGDAGVA